MRSVVDGAVRVLRALPETTGAGQIARLAQLTGLPRPTVHRLLAQLRENGMVAWRDGRWLLGSAVLELAQRVEPVAGLRSTAARVIQDLRDQTGATVSLVVPDDGAFTALEMIPGHERLPIEAHAGANMPPSTAAALVLAPANRTNPGGLTSKANPGGPALTTSLTGPMSRTEATRGRLRPFHGAVDQEHVLPGLTCYAVAVSLPNGQRASLQIATSVAHPAERFAAAVHHAGADLQRALKTA